MSQNGSSNFGHWVIQNYLRGLMVTFLSTLEVILVIFAIFRFLVLSCTPPTCLVNGGASGLPEGGGADLSIRNF